jgi:Flp pilus assembly CpaF family ATPase
MTAAKTIGRQMARRLNANDPILNLRLRDKSPVNIIIDPCYNRAPASPSASSWQITSRGSI